jgi:NAD(P)-dependent dehydrogenase (short-subunit alcohol dehydrogenase family)
MSGRLAGKIALVTGIGGGIGRGIALMFARQGAAVVGCDINSSSAADAMMESAAAGFPIESFHPCNLTQPGDVQRYVDFAVAKHGRIDIVVNAAAIPPHMAPLATMDYEKQWIPTMVGEVDLVFLLCKAAWPHLLVGGRSAIVNFASVSAVRGSLHMGMVAHCAGKAAVAAMTRQLAIEGGGRVRANAIAPGMVVTPATQSAGAATDGPIRDSILARLPIKRLGQPEDIAWAAVYLASDEASWVTGVMLPVDGGVTAA